MHDPAYELLRITLPRTSVNKGERTKGQGGNRPPCMGRFGRTKKRVGGPFGRALAPSPVAIPATSWLRLAARPRLSRRVSYSEPQPKGPRTAGVYRRDPL
jgi:hypothetical protein